MAAWIEERFGVRLKVSEQDLAVAKQLRDALAQLVTNIGSQTVQALRNVVRASAHQC